MNANRSIFVSDARRMLSFVGLLMIVLAASLLLTESAVMKSEAPLAADLTARDSVLGKLAYQKTVFFNSGAVTTFLMTANADGSGETSIAPGSNGIPTFNAEPAWSPDGTKIVYTTNLFGLHSVNADGSNRMALTNNQDRYPSWSAMGKIAFERGGQIWVMNANGSNQMQFPGISQSSPVAPAWSPDGSKMAFASGGEIWVINADGTNQRRVTNNPTVDADPAWSPDGAKIIFGKGGSGIAVINLDGTSEMNLTTTGLDGKPSWSSDGTRMAFVRRDGVNGGIFTMDANGANQVRIVADQLSQPGRNENDNPAWQPIPAAPNTFTISGRITRVGASLSNVTVALSGTTTATTVTNSLGNYQFSNLPQNGNYTITPSLANHVFAPPSHAFTNLTANQIADFTARETCPTPNCRTNGRIVFVRNSDIYTASPDGSNPINLTNNPATDNEPAYSPDGNKIVFESNRDGNWKFI
jgi:Tol biopolymer transport system component